MMLLDLICCVLLSASLARAEEATTEAALVEHVEAHREEALALIERTVEINSGTMNFEGVRRVGEIFAAEYEGLGFAVRWVDGVEFERAGHLVAEWPTDGDGAGRPHLLLIGHLDTVFESDSPFQSYERLSESAARGPGIIDMKGGDVVMLYALRALQATGGLDELRITVVLTGDEEKPGRPLSETRRVLVEAARTADAAIGFEDGDGDPQTAVVARRGSASWELTTTGVPAHSSWVFREEIGAGAIYEASRILYRFYLELAEEPDLTFNPGVILGGTEVDFDSREGKGRAFGKTNVVAERAVVAGDLRALSPEQYDRATEAMRRIVAEHLPRAGAEITFSEGYPPLAPSEGNRRLLALYDEVSRDLGYGEVTAVDPRNAGAADVSFAAPHVPMVLDGIGLMGDGGHTVEETADLDTLPMQMARAALFLHRLGRMLREE